MSLPFPSNEKTLLELELLVRAHHPLWLCETTEEDRLEQLLGDLADRVKIPFFSWSPITALVRHAPGAESTRTLGTESLTKCLAFLAQANYEGIFLLKGVGKSLDDATIVAQVKELYRLYFGHHGTLVLTSAVVELPPDLEPLVSPIEIPTPTLEEYYRYVRTVLADVASQRAVKIDLDSAGVSELLQGLNGLSFFDVRRVITRAVVDDGRLSREDLPLVLDVKKRIIQRAGVLEFFPHAHAMDEVAGLENLKAWLRKRHRAFLDPSGAKRFGLEPPRGLLLIGVQGCGKSLTAKAIATEWKLPLVRLDPSNLYTKYLGESERNFKKAVSVAESLAPVVLWVDEIEKALSQGGEDSGTSQRVFGTFLAWLQEKRANVFVIATANDISRLPPELLRKGRFDEIFFLDLPNERARREILDVHLRRRGREPSDFDVAALAAASPGFSGAELEQAVVAALYSAFELGEALSTEHMRREIAGTRPMSITMAEPIGRLRDWARDRAVHAEIADNTPD